MSSAVVHTSSDRIITSEDQLGVWKGEPALQCRRQSAHQTPHHRSQVQGLLRESWTKGSSGVRPVICWAGLMGYEDMKAEDYIRVWIGLYLAWKAS